MASTDDDTVTLQLDGREVLVTHASKLLFPEAKATKLDLAINLKAAEAMGIVVPPSLLLAADHVIR